VAEALSPAVARRPNLNLVFGLTLTSGRAGQSSGAVITYSSAAARHVLDDAVSIMVSQDCFAEPRPWNGT